MRSPALKSRFATIAMAALLAAALILTAGPAEARRKARRAAAYVPPYAGLVMDASTGEFLYARNIDAPLRPASLTKIMTLLMVFEALERGDLSLSDRVRISARAASMPPSKLGVDAGDTISVREAIYAVVTKSCNDVAVALAEKLGGSEGAFARKMTARARAMGMTRSMFVNASGLPNPGQISSARDMATLARYVIQNYPSYYRYFGTRDFYFQGQRLHNHNRLMDTYSGMDGMKTGFIGDSGYNLVASAARGGRRLIGVVFGGRTANSRNALMARLLDDGFARVKSPDSTLVAAAREAVAPPAGAIIASASAAETIEPADGRTFAFAQATGDADEEDTAPQKTASAAPSLGSGFTSWAVQVGAFSSRAATDEALSDSMKKLPVQYASVSPIIAPMKTPDGWVFRGRLQGLSKSAAFAACRYLNECVPVAPRAP